MTSGNLACVRRNAHTPHGTCPGTAPEFPSEKVEQVTDGYGLTRAEDAYAHLASFQRGDAVDVGGRTFFLPGAVTTPQQHDHADINRAYLVVAGVGPFDTPVTVTVTVGSLLSGKHTITSIADARAGNVRYFDAAGYAAQDS